MTTTLFAVAAKSAVPSGSRAERAVNALPTVPTNLSNFERISSAVGGSLLATLGLDGKGPGLASVLGGGYLIWRAATGNCPVYQALGVSTAPQIPKSRTAALQATAGDEVHHAVTINKSAAELYTFWHDFTNLPKFMEHLERVDVHGGKLSHWVTRGPLGMRLEWDAETTVDIVNREIGWRSTADADVDTVGSVQFKELPAGRGTELRLSMRYAPPGGRAGVLISKLFGQSPQAQIESDLRKLKQLVETGEIATLEGQPSGRR